MKNRKYLTKGLAGVLAAGMIAGGALTAFAADPQTGSMSVTFTKTAPDSTFTLSIPSSVTLLEDKEVTEKVGLSAISVADTEKVQIRVASGITNGQVTLTDNDISRSVSSTVSLDGTTAIGNNAVVAEFSGTSTTPTTGGTLHFSAVGIDAEVGNYTGTITFEASIVDK
ncbi:hypothetical protein SAMN05660368_03232 [Marvinbryantia formatexigens]|nr:hypothetical protein SAMN05660368_03232 [Marvinbryantia formatexigens]